jgi:hypothetical protein
MVEIRLEIGYQADVIKNLGADYLSQEVIRELFAGI